jgi:Patatin-like phospholipase
MSLTSRKREGAMNGATEKNDVLSIEEVLAAEAKEIDGDTPDTEKLKRDAIDQKTQEKRLHLNEDRRALQNLGAEKIKSRDEFYRILNRLNHAALCLSGGGQRSAVFCLGVLQALAACDVDHLTANEGTSPKPEQEQPEQSAIKPEKSLLGHFHYLSTVSGGGYIGSWLSAWRTRSNFETVIDNLTGRPKGADIEPPAISWLRAYSNYLTPKLGVTSADGWAAVAICVRNLILNWLVIIPIVCFVLLALKLTATIGVWVAHHADDSELMIRLVLWGAFFGAFFLIVAQGFTNSHRPSRQSGPGDAADWTFILGDLMWAVASAILLTVLFTSHFFWSRLEPAVGPLWLRLEHAVDPIVQHVGLTDILNRPDLKFKFLTMAAVAGLLVYSIGWIAGLIFRVGRDFISGPRSRKGWHDFISGIRSGEGWRDFVSWLRFREGWRDFFCWAASGLVYGVLIGLGAYLFHLLTPYPAEPKKLLVLLLAMTLGVPWVLTSQLMAGIVFVGLASYEDKSDPDREWLGRAGGWIAAAAVAWALIAFLVFDGGYFVQIASGPVHRYIVASGGVIGVISGIVTALLGSNSGTAAKSTSKDQGSFKSTLYNIVLAAAGPIFVAVLIIALSVALDLLLLGDALVNEIQTQTQRTPTTLSWTEIGTWLAIGLVVAAVVGGLASVFVNINRFSLHALYRNRLIRAYLGASNEKREPDAFSGFDFKDNIRVHQLWSKDRTENRNRLFHVINIALNVVSTKRLAWQELKAESFTVTPLHCGSSYLGFRSSEEYGDALKTEQEKRDAAAGKRDYGIALGTAVAISGAAVSPNMGYHSSPSIALLLTLFNVRLGWWLGNPGEVGERTYKEDGPLLAARPLFSEAFGLTTDASPYVYLSDGGHFENLGLYEMVRRRCRLIVLVDAGCDPNFAFEDLGNAVRKIYIDLGIRITFDDLGILKNRPSARSVGRAMRDAAARVMVLAAVERDKEREKEEKENVTPQGEPVKTSEAGGKGGKITVPAEPPYYAVGKIHYKHADGPTADNQGEPVENGHILYIKPAYHGAETSAGIRSYATANPDFPHETTVDQWFTESQFESYRSLGLDIGRKVLREKAVKEILKSFLKH